MKLDIVMKRRAPWLRLREVDWNSGRYAHSDTREASVAA